MNRFFTYQKVLQAGPFLIYMTSKSIFLVLAKWEIGGSLFCAEVPRYVLVV